MATSRYESLPDIVTYLRQTNPQSVLDLGVGFGKVGLLVREYLEAWNDRVTPKDWEVYVEGVEIFPGYHKDSIQPTVYNAIRYGDALDYRPQREFDLATCLDMLEHLKKDDGKKLLERLPSFAKSILLSVPVGKGWLREAYGKNQREAHLAEWEVAEIEGFGFDKIAVHVLPDKRAVGLFACSKF